MQLSDYDQLPESEKIKINEFIEENIETIYDERKSYKTFIDFNQRHLTVDKNEDTEEFVDKCFVGYFCNKCGDWIEGTGDVALVEHVMEHIQDASAVNDI